MGKRGAAQIEEEIESSLRAAHARKRLSIAAIGLWHIMRFEIDHNSSHAGHLYLGRSPGSLSDLAEMVRVDFPRVSCLFQRLSAVVLGKRADKRRPLVELSESGHVYSFWLLKLAEYRRHAADRVNRHRVKESGSALHRHRKALHNAEVGVTVGVTSPPEVPPPITPSSLPPSSLKPGEADRANAPPLGEEIPAKDRWRRMDDWVWAGMALPLQTDDFRNAFADWIEMRREMGKLSAFTVRAQLVECLKLGPNRAIAALKNSVANGYSGVVEPRVNGSGRSGHPPPRREIKPGLRDYGPARPGKV